MAFAQASGVKRPTVVGDGERAVEHIEALRQQPDRHRESHLASRRCELAGDRGQERGLASAVRTQQCAALGFRTCSVASGLKHGRIS